MKQIRLYAMNSKGWAVLQALVKNFGPSLFSAVVAERDPALFKDFYNEMEELCRQQGIAFFNRKEATPPGLIPTLAVGWRWMLPVHSELFILHDSLLPRYRGFGPLVTALINGEKEMGVTLLMASEGYDEGPIVGQKKISLDYPVRMGELLPRIEGLYQELAVELCTSLTQEKKLSPRVQNEADATYSLWRDERDYRLDFPDSAARLRRKVDALSAPLPGARCLVNDEEMRVLEAEDLPDLHIENRNVGKVIFYRDKCPVVVCGKGLLKIKKLLTQSDTEISFPLKNFRTRFE